MPGKSLSEKQKRAARAKRGEDPKGPPKKVAPKAGAVPTTTATDILGMPVPTEEELVPTKGKLKTKAGSNNRKMIIALIVLGAVVLIVGAYLIISTAGLHGAVKAANTFSNQ